MELNVYALPTLFKPKQLIGSTAVVIDALRATTTILFALHSGAKEVVTLLDIQETLGRRDTYPAGTVVLGGERSGVKIEGFDWGNSPESFSPAVVEGKTVLFTTTNGTVAMHAAKSADQVFLACFMNAAAVVEKLTGCEKISIICAGTDGKPTEEDVLVAGCLTGRLQRQSEYRYSLNAQAVAAQELWDSSFSVSRVVGEEPIPAETLAQILRRSRGGTNLMELGLGADILTASRLDSIPVVPRFVDGVVVG